MNKSTTAKKPGNAFSSLSSVLSEGFGDLMTEGDEFAEVPLDDIMVEPQVREEFEDEENTDAEMQASIRKHGVFQPIVIRRVEGFPKPYKLVAGERRYRNSRGAGKTTVPSIIKKNMTDEEAAAVQFAENVQRKNLTQIEQAKRIQKDLDELGSVEAVLEKHSKGRAWLSKILSLLKLPEQAKRLISEKVSSDLEVINAVKTIEKHDPAKAKNLVDTLKATRGKEDARKQVAKVKDEVKPQSAKKAAAKAAEQGGNVATAKDRSAEQPSEAQVFSGAKKSGANDSPRPVVFTPAQALSTAYTRIFEHGDSPKKIFDAMKADDKTTVEDWLRTYYEAGTKAKDIGRAVIQSFRKGQFSSDGEGAFALVAFLHGADGDAKFNLLNILGSVKE
jgi:ParB family chromosome partitioning protein